MPLRTEDEYRESLRDGRRIIYRGREVHDVTTHPALRRTIDHSADLFTFPKDGPEDFWSYLDEELEDELSAYFYKPMDAASLMWRADLIEETTRRSGTTLNIVKAVGTDALLALEAVAQSLDEEHGCEYGARVAAFRARCARQDLAMSVAATDPKGDRSLPPSAQPDPDSYLRIIDRDVKGITVRGAKLHTTAAPSANELICIPCRALGEDDSNYAVAFAVPLNAPGLSLVAHPIDPGPNEEHPVSRRHIEVETTTIFDDVKIPWERVFLCGEYTYAGEIAGTFANYHRYTALSYKPPVIDLIIGAAALVADQLGIARAGHVRTKLGELVVYGALIRAARVAAAQKCRTLPGGLAWPDSVMTNAGKFHFASRFHEIVGMLQDLAGGLIITAPGIEDLEHQEFGPMVAKYLGAREGVAGRARWDLVQLIRDLTASDFGGYNLVVTLHGEGSQQAQLISALRDFDMDSCTDLVKEVLRK